MELIKPESDEPLDVVMFSKLVKIHAMNDQPFYKDFDTCIDCRFLGNYKEYDLYWCYQMGVPTVIWVNEDGGNYGSGMPRTEEAMRTLGDDYPSVVAKRRAIALGYQVEPTERR